MQRCPACHARYKEGSVCTRCGTDLSLALRAEQQAIAYLKLAIQYLIDQNRDGAQAALQQSLLLQHIPLAVSLDQFLKHTAVEMEGSVIHRRAERD